MQRPMSKLERLGYQLGLFGWCPLHKGMVWFHWCGEDRWDWGA